MSKTIGKRGGGAGPQTAKKAFPAANAPGKTLNLRSPPIKVTGIPKDLFLIYDVILTVSGPDTIAVTLMEKGKRDGIPIPYSEIAGLNRAAGFVKQNLKTTTNTELAEQTRSLFFKTKKDPREASDPKLLVKKALDHQSNIDKTLDMLKVKKTGPMEEFAASFVQEIASRAATCGSTFLQNGMEGKKEDPDVLTQSGLPKSLRSKFLTGSLPQTAPNIFSALVGKELEKFASITLGELHFMPTDLLSLFLSSEDQTTLKALTTKEEVKKWFCLDEKSELNEKQKGEIENLSFPCGNYLSKLGTLERYDKTKELPKLKNLESSKFPAFDRQYNKILTEKFFVPPSDVAKVKEFWEKLSGIKMIDPTIGSKSFRAQAIERLQEVDRNPLADEKVNFSPDIDSDIKVGKQKLKDLTSLAVSTLRSDGSVVHVDLEGFNDYMPFCIVGEQKTATKKKMNSDGFNRRSDLTKVSKKYVSALAENGIKKSFLAEVKTYLMTFGLPQIQEIAAKTVYHTMHQTVKVAREFHLGEKPGDAEDSESDSDDDEDSSNKGAKGGEEESPLPKPDNADGSASHE